MQTYVKQEKRHVDVMKSYWELWKGIEGYEST